MTLEFNVPDGCVFDKDSVTIKDGKVTIDLKEKQRFSKDWEEFCENNKIDTDEIYILDNSKLAHPYRIRKREKEDDKCLIPAKFAKPMRALMQLLTIREKEYTKGWEPDWENPFQFNFFLFVPEKGDAFRLHHSCVLSFPTAELLDEFEKNWKDLIEIAKPLL